MVHQGLVGFLTSCICSSSRRRASTSRRQTNSTLGLKKPTFWPWYTIYYLAKLKFSLLQNWQKYACYRNVRFHASVRSRDSSLVRASDIKLYLPRLLMFIKFSMNSFSHLCIYDVRKEISTELNIFINPILFLLPKIYIFVVYMFDKFHPDTL